MRAVDKPLGPMYRVSKQLWFSAAHQVRLSETQCEAMHGHNYRIIVHAEAKELDRTSYVIDFAELKKAAAEACGRGVRLKWPQEIPGQLLQVEKRS